MGWVGRVKVRSWVIWHGPHPTPFILSVQVGLACASLLDALSQVFRVGLGFRSKIMARIWPVNYHRLKTMARVCCIGRVMLARGSLLDMSGKVFSGSVGL